MNRTLAVLFASAFLVAAAACDDVIPTDCVTENLDEPFSMPIMATGKLSPNVSGHAVALGMYKKHCEGSLGDRMEYHYESDEEMLYLTKITLGTYSISVKNSKESLLLDLSVDGFPLVSGGSTSVSASTYSECRRGLAITFEITCEPGAKQCRGKTITSRCQ